MLEEGFEEGFEKEEFPHAFDFGMDGEDVEGIGLEAEAVSVDEAIFGEFRPSEPFVKGGEGRGDLEGFEDSTADLREKWADSASIAGEKEVLGVVNVPGPFVDLPTWRTGAGGPLTKDLPKNSLRAFEFVGNFLLREIVDVILPKIMIVGMDPDVKPLILNSF